MNKYDEIKDAAVLLIAAVGSTTTLNVKNYLRTKYPFEKWVQSEISKGLNDCLKGDIPYLRYTDGGQYRTYTIEDPNQAIKQSKIKSNSLPKQAPVGVTPVPITRTELIKKMMNSKGKFMRVTFIKKTTGKVRVMNCNVKKDNFYNTLGHINVKEKGQIKQIIPANLRSLMIGGVSYTIK